MNLKPIGVFDSGIGGLTVYQALKKKMPDEQVIYLGDTAHLPYGSKSAQTIIKYSEKNAMFLMTKGVKMIVIACNSSSSYAIPHLRENLDIPVIGVIEPGAAAAVRGNACKIGVIGTTATIQSGVYEKTIRGLKPDLEIISRDCPLFVPLVEEGWLDHPVTRMVVEEYLLPLKTEGIEKLVLGCTHYPVLKRVLGKVIGSGIQLIDSGETAAEKVFQILCGKDWLREPGDRGEDEFYVTDFPERFKKIGEIFLRRSIQKVSAVPFDF